MLIARHRRPDARRFLDDTRVVANHFLLKHSSEARPNRRTIRGGNQPARRREFFRCQRLLRAGQVVPQRRLIGSLGLPSLNVPQAAPPSAALYAETAAPNEFNLIGVGELRTYIKCVRIDDQTVTLIACFEGISA